MKLLLSLFPGIDLFGRAFELEGYCVVRGPDRIYGSDIRNFQVPPGRFDGVFGGSPCQGFSAANRKRVDPSHHSVRNSNELLDEFMRVVGESQPTWFMLENVPGVPDVIAQGYNVQRIPISAHECGGDQIRNRHIQFGHKLGYIIRPERINDSVTPRSPKEALTTKTGAGVTFTEHCRRQGFDEIYLPGFTKEGKFTAVGNGVPLSIGSALAKSVALASAVTELDCPCGCGRTLTGKQKSATVACRKRLSIRRKK